MSENKGTGAATELSRRVRGLIGLPGLDLNLRIEAARERGERIFDLSSGEPDIPTPRHVSMTAVNALGAGRTRYTSPLGLPELRAAVTERYQKDFRVTFSEPEVAVTCGGRQALHVVCQSLIDRGDEVVIPTPHSPVYSEAARMAGARVILVQTPERDGFKITARTISRATSPRTKLVILNSPANPTGNVIDPEDLLVIGDMAQRRKFTIVYDDSDARLVYQSQDSPVLQALRDSVGDRLVIIGTASRAYCMTGWRIGWVLGPSALVLACGALVCQQSHGPATFAQVGAAEALTGTQKPLQELVAEYRRRRDFFFSALTALLKVSCAEPVGGVHLFPSFARYLGPKLPTTIDLARRLLDEKQVAVVPGEVFGAPGHLRISFTLPMDDLKDAVERIRTMLASL